MTNSYNFFAVVRDTHLRLSDEAMYLLIMNLCLRYYERENISISRGKHFAIPTLSLPQSQCWCCPHRNRYILPVHVVLVMPARVQTRQSVSVTIIRRPYISIVSFGGSILAMMDSGVHQES